ncbi:MAG: FtsX-like permease family protein [Bacteroidales bacterium]
MNPLLKLKNNWKWFVINTVGLSVALACIIIVFLFVRKEMSYDRFHSKADQIYRITLNTNTGATSMHPARVAGKWPLEIAKEYPAIEKVVRLIPYRRSMVKINDEIFYSERIFSTDSTFFDVFDFKVLVGNVKQSFTKPYQAFISQSMAMKYFDSVNVIGKEISIIGQQGYESKNYTIEGIMEDFPANSHFHADLLTSGTEFDGQDSWAYTYFLLKKRTNVKDLLSNIQTKWEKENKNAEITPIIYLQNITDIHLKSHKTRELEKNGDIRSLILLISGAFIILLIALVNFLNLSRVQFISRLKCIKVKLINGASKRHIGREMAANSVFVSLMSVIAGCIIAYWIAETIDNHLFTGQTGVVLLISLAFIAFIAILSIVPLYTSEINMNMTLKQKQGKLYTFPLVIQFTLAVITISGTIALNKQMNFINSQHPVSESANMIVLPYNHAGVVRNYDILKAELLKNPSIKEVTSCMEAPGGDINDAFPFEMEGIQTEDKRIINVLATDSGFFEFMRIKPLAGTTQLGYTPSLQWEQNAIELSTRKEMENNDSKRVAELEKSLGNYREKYILNMSALKLIGIDQPEKAIGKRFQLKFPMPYLFPEGEIVGVVPDFHYTNLHHEERPLVIAPRKIFSYNFIIRIAPGQQKEALATLNTVWKKINPGYPIYYEYITDSYRKVYAEEYSQTRVLSLFAIISIILSSLGIFAMASFNMQRKVKEIGIRKVNGAKISEVIVMLNKDFVKWIAISFLIAAPIAYYATNKWLQNFAYKTTLSWWIFALAGLIALTIVLVTVSWQSWKAATRNPVEALRYE